MTFWLTAVGWTWLLAAVATVVPALGLAAWLLSQRLAPAQRLYRGAVAALLACVMLAVLAPLALQQRAESAPLTASSSLAPTAPGLAPARAAAPVAPATWWTPSINGVVQALGGFVLFGAAVMAARLLGGWLVVRRLARRSLACASPELQGIVDDLRHEMGVDTEVRACLSDEVGAPMIVGVRPLLVMPRHLSANLAAEQLRPLLAHELAHAARRDYAANLAQAVIDVLLFACPGARWISGRVREMREYCCDERALEVCGDARRYADVLGTLAERTLRRPAIALGASGPGLASRIARLIAGDRSVRFQWLRVTGLMLATAATVVGAERLSVTASVALSRPKPAPLQSGDGFAVTVAAYAAEQPGAGVTMTQLSVTPNFACDYARVRNDSNVAVTGIAFLAVAMFGRGDRPVQNFTTDVLPVRIPPKASADIRPQLLDHEGQMALGRTTSKVSIMCALTKVEFENGYGWELTPNPAARTFDAALSLPPAELPRALLAESQPAVTGYVCRDHRDGEYSIGAMIQIQYEPGTFAQCVDASPSPDRPAVRWIESRSQRRE